jgi:regulator of sigma E protease
VGETGDEQVDFCLIAAGLIDLETIWSIARVVLGLGFVVFVHELGHFLAAKMCGVKCEKFYVGFDFFDIKIGDRVIIPRALLKWRWGETEYGIGVIPLGGYVKMLGQEDNPSQIEEENKRSLASGVDSTTTSATAGPIDREQIDPRSYRAKSVLQRMWIISAGVIFNLIFAVILAAIAFRSGVNYQPTTVGMTVIGSVAWEENLDGATFLRINNRRLDEGYAPFMEIVQQIGLAGTGNEVELEYLPLGESTPRTIKVKPMPRDIGGGLRLPMLGVQPEQGLRLGAGDPTGTGLAADKAGLVGLDRILSIDGKTIQQFSELKRLLSQNPDKTVELSVERRTLVPGGEPKVETLPIKVDANPMREIGFAFELGPVVAIRNNSPASQSGIQKGDRLKSLNGEVVGDPFTLDQRLIELHRAGQGDVELIVERKDGDKVTDVTLKASVRLPLINGNYDESILSFECLGIACQIMAGVSQVEPGSALEKAGVKVGDRLASFKYQIAEKYAGEADMKALAKRNSGMIVDPKTQDTEPMGFGEWLGSLFTTPPNQATPPVFVLGIVNRLPEDTKYTLTFVRGDNEAIDCEVVSRLSDRYYQATRGMQMGLVSREYVSPTWRDAFQLGAKQVQSDLSTIMKSLKRLVTGEISPKAIGGIGTIGVVATTEAGEGTSRLLLFLTMLSANLAIINLLPIPVLDGGHLMFLAYEGIFRRPVTEQVQIALSWVGLVFILGLMSFAIFMDITRFIEWLR